MFTEQIPVNKVAISHVVGKGGETIKTLKASTNTQIDVQEGVVKIVGEEADVKKARALIEKIIADQANPDYEGPEGKRLRGEADAAGRRRDELKAEADAQFLSGDRDAGFKLVTESKKAGEMISTKNKEAAAAILKHRNEGKGDAYLDLHGLRTEEAIEATKKRFAELEDKPMGTTTDLELIPGAGHHSNAAGGIALKPACEKLILERQYTFKNISAGSLLVTIRGRGKVVTKKAAKEDEPKAGPDTSTSVEPQPAADDAIVPAKSWCAIM